MTVLELYVKLQVNMSEQQPTDERDPERLYDNLDKINSQIAHALIYFATDNPLLSELENKKQAIDQEITSLQEKIDPNLPSAIAFLRELQAQDQISTPIRDIIAAQYGEEAALFVDRQVQETVAVTTEPVVTTSTPVFSTPEDAPPQDQDGTETVKEMEKTVAIQFVNDREIIIDGLPLKLTPKRVQFLKKYEALHQDLMHQIPGLASRYIEIEGDDDPIAFGEGFVSASLLRDFIVKNMKSDSTVSSYVNGINQTLERNGLPYRFVSRGGGNATEYQLVYRQPLPGNATEEKVTETEPLFEQLLGSNQFNQEERIFLEIIHSNPTISTLMLTKKIREKLRNYSSTNSVLAKKINRTLTSMGADFQISFEGTRRGARYSIVELDQSVEDTEDGTVPSFFESACLISHIRNEANRLMQQGITELPPTALYRDLIERVPKRDDLGDEKKKVKEDKIKQARKKAINKIMALIESEAIDEVCDKLKEANDPRYDLVIYILINAEKAMLLKQVSASGITGVGETEVSNKVSIIRNFATILSLSNGESD